VRRHSPAHLSALCIGLAATGAVTTAACTSNDPATLETMPPIRTTTSTTIATTPPTTRPKTYEIQLGEPLFAVAQKFDLSVAELAAFNGITNPDDVQAGQVIRIPPAEPTTVTSTATP